jgi:hypothetical protein
MSVIFNCVAIVLFLIAGIVIAASGDIGLEPAALVAFGLASHSAAHLPIP